MSKVHNQTLLDDMVRHQSLPMPQVKQAASEILTIIREGLIRDGVVNVSNFGTFRLKPVAERHGINPQTREPIIIPAHQRVIFSPCKALRELIQPVHKPPVPIQPDDVTTPNKTDGSVLAEQSQAKEPPLQETKNKDATANTDGSVLAEQSQAKEPPLQETKNKDAAADTDGSVLAEQPQVNEPPLQETANKDTTTDTDGSVLAERLQVNETPLQETASKDTTADTDGSVLAEQPQVNETPLQETANKDTTANIEDMTATTGEQNTIAPQKEEPLSSDEISALTNQIVEQQEPAAASSATIELSQSAPVEAVQEKPVIANTSHGALEISAVEQLTAAESNSVTDRKYTKATALLLIALVCTGLFFEFGYNRETETESTATAPTQTAESTIPLPDNDTAEADTSDTHTITEESTDTIVTERDTPVPANTTSAIIASDESQTTTQVSDSATVSDDNTVATVNTTITDAEQGDIKVAPASTASTATVSSTASNQSADTFFQEQPHKVAHGESLWRLSRRYFQDPLLWPHIFQANASTIDDPDHLAEGGSIIIPTLEGSPDKLSRQDRHNIAEGYYLTYEHYKKLGRHEAFFALLEAKRYDNSVVEEHRRLLQLSQVEEIMLETQETMPF